MIKVLWFLVVFKNKILSDPKELMVGKGGFEPPPFFFSKTISIGYSVEITILVVPCGFHLLNLTKPIISIG